jgi:hypothetical protein
MKKILTVQWFYWNSEKSSQQLMTINCAFLLVLAVIKDTLFKSLF